MEFVADSQIAALAETSRPTVLVAGGGIAGLSLALFLERNVACNVRLFERSPDLSPALGAHYGLNGALECLDRAGLRHVWEPLLNKLEHMRFCRHGSPLKFEFNLHRAMAGTEFEGKFGAFMRGEFQMALAEALTPGVLECGKQIVDVQEDSHKVRVSFADGSSAEGDILVATDGINSAVRRLVFPEMHKVYAGYQCWYLIHNDPPPQAYQHSMTELRSKDAITMVFAAGRSSQHVVLVVKRAPEEPTREQLERETSTEHFHQVFTEIGAYEAGLVSEEKLHTATRLLHFALYNMPPGAKTWSRGRVCLLGDAAHATTPFLGQGANQAVQSAYCLARLLHERGIDNYHSIFEEVHSIREPPTSNVITTSEALANIRVPSPDEGCFKGLRRFFTYAMLHLLPAEFWGKRMANAMQVRV